MKSPDFFQQYAQRIINSKKYTVKRRIEWRDAERNTVVFAIDAGAKINCHIVQSEHLIAVEDPKEREVRFIPFFMACLRINGFQKDFCVDGE